MRIIFMGSPDFSIDALNLLASSNSEVIAVYTKAPKSSGRGQRLTKSPVHAFAERCGIKVCTPASLKSSIEKERFINFAPDIVVVVAYGLIIPKEILNVPKYGFINMHPSLLPKWRGATPIQHAILAGDQETGVSIIQLDEGLDSGPILKQGKLLIKENDNYKVLHDRLSQLGSSLLLEILSEIGKHVPVEQDGNDTCYAGIIEDYKIYPNDTCEVAYRKVKAFYPKAFIKIENKRIRILDAAHHLKGFSSEEGMIINHNMHLSLNGGILIPKVVQMEGKNPCSVDDFIRGLRLNIIKKFIE